MIRIVALALAVLTVVTVVAPASAHDLEGTWEGKLRIDLVELGIVLHLRHGLDGALEGTLDSPDQGVDGILITSVAVREGTVTIDVPRIGASIVGEIDPSGTKISGQMRQAGAFFALDLRKVSEPTKPSRPQEPQLPLTYDEVHVRYENAAASVALAGTLSLPRRRARLPAVILVSGSGPSDRDETGFGHRPYLVLADALARRGIAVLRVDDRGVGGSSGSLETSTPADLAEDVRAGIRFLRSRDDIDEDRIGLIGHSQGGLVAALAAAEEDRVAFVVLMSASGVPGHALAEQQLESLMRSGNAVGESIERQRKRLQQLFDVIRTAGSPAEMRPRLAEVLERQYADLSAAEARGIGDRRTLVDQQIRRLTSPEFLFLFHSEPCTVIARLRCPVLALAGSRDVQVPPGPNLAAIEGALRTGGNGRSLACELPNVNHMLQTCSTGKIEEYASISETVSPRVLELLTLWLETAVLRTSLAGQDKPR